MAKYQYPEPAQRALSESYEFVYSKNKSKEHIDKLDPNFGTIQSMPKVDLEERNDHLRRWRTLKNFRQGLPIVNYLDNESNPVIMVLGGINTVQPTDYLNSAAMFLFHPDRNKWNFLGTILEPRVYHAGAYLHGRVYVFGGYNPLECVKDKMQITSTTFQYTLRSRQWRRRTHMRNTRAYHGATVMDERIFVIGGKDSVGNILASVEVYQPEIDQWTTAASMPQPLMGIAVTNNCGFIYVIGGVGCVREKKTETYLSGKVYCFNPLYNKWFRKSPLASPRAFAAATTQNKRIWIWGGANLLGSDETLSTINTVDVLDTRTGSLEHHLSFDLPKHCITVAKTKDQVFVIGGMSSLKQTATAEVEIYDRKLDLMQTWASLPIALTGMVAVVIPTDTGVASKIEQFTTRTKKTDIQRRQQAAKMIQMEYRKYYKKKVKANGHRQNYIVKQMSIDADEIIFGRFRAYQSGYRPKLPDQDDVSKDLIPVSIPAWPPDPDPVDSVFATVIDQCHDPNESVGFKHYYTLPLHMDPNIGMIQCLDEDYQHSKNILGLRNVEKIPYYMNRFQPTGDIQDFSVPVIITVGGVDPRDPMNLSYGRSVFQYHPLKDRWEFFGLMPVPRNYHAAVYYNGMIYVTGGYDPNIRRWGEMVATKTTFTYKLSVKEWSRISDMRCTRSHHTMVVFNNSIYAIGGRDSSGRLVASVEIYSPETDEWEMEKPMPKPRMGMASVPHAGYIWVLGGFTSIKSGEKKSSVLDDVLCYDPILKQWVKGSPLRIPKVYSAALVCEGHIWLCGGAVPSLDRNNCLVSVSSIDVYDEETQEWKQETLLNHPRHSAVAIALESCIYVIGGINSFEMSPTSRNVLYMTDTKTIHPIRELPIPVTGMAGVTVPPKCLTFRSESLSIMIRHKVTPKSPPL